MNINEFNQADAIANLEMQRIEQDLAESTTEIALGLISKTMNESQAGILLFDRIEKDEFVSSERLRDIASRATVNNKALLAECEALMATAQVVSSIMSGLEKNALQSCSDASDAVKVLMAYHSALGNTGRSILVVPDHLKGTHKVIGGSITSEVVSGTDAMARVSSYQTNGLVGNMLEIRPGVINRVALDGSEFSFIDPSGAHALQSAVTDGDELSMFEVEGYIVDDVFTIAANSRNVMPATRVKVEKAVRNGTDPVHMVPVDWSRFDSDDGLYVDVLMKTTTGAISAINLKIAERTDVNGMSIPLPVVDRVDISVDGKSWQTIPCRYDAITSSAGGEILVHVNSGVASFLRVRLRQSSSYSTSVINAGHWLSPSDGSEGHWMIGDDPVFKIGVHNKLDWFCPTLLKDVDGNLIERRVFAIPANRYAIAIREVRAEVYRYAADTVVESSSYKMPRPVQSVMLRASEIIPDGTSISYEVSPDDGGTWVEIVPVERSGQGAEVILFTAGGYSNPNIKSAKYVPVTKYPTSLRVRAHLSATDSKAPSFSNLSIEPTFSEE